MPQGEKQVLIIDDNKTFVMYVGLLLRRLGIEVIAAETSLEGLKRLKTDPPDCVLLDLVMPDMGGVEMLRVIRSDDELAQLPVIMVSVDGSEKTREMCSKLGASEYLTKPLRLNQLNTALHQVLQYSTGSRKNLRVAFDQPVSVFCNGKREKLHATTLSEGGIYFRMKDALPVRTTMEVLLPLGTQRTLTLTGEVIYQRGVYSNYSWAEPGIAVRFQDLSPQQSKRLSEFISYQLAGDLREEQDQPVICFDDDALEVEGKKQA